MEDYSQPQWQAQLTPSPQGFSSLPRVSEAFTPNTTINPQQQLKKIKPNANRFNKLTQHTQTFTTYAICKHIDFFKHTLTIPILNFHEMRETWHEALTSFQADGYKKKW